MFATLVLSVAAALGLSACDAKRSHSAGPGASTVAEPTNATTPPPAPAWVSLLGIRLGARVEDLQRRHPSVPCEARGEEAQCTFPSERGEIQVEFVDGVVRNARLRGRSFDDHPHEMRRPNRHSLYNALVRDLGQPAEEWEGLDYGGYLGTWRGADGSELALEIQRFGLVSGVWFELTLGKPGLAHDLVTANLGAFDQHLAALVTTTADRGVALAGVRLGNPLPSALQAYCPPSARTCSTPWDWERTGKFPNQDLQILRDADGRVMQVDLTLPYTLDDNGAIVRGMERLQLLTYTAPRDDLLVYHGQWSGPKGEVLRYLPRDGSTGARLQLAHPTPKAEGFGPPRT